jgi:hypothetical protein
MWEPHAALRRLKKPVEFVMLETDEHIVTNPVTRLASQGQSIDWFRFWLMGEEDRDPAKAAQYRHWHQLLDRKKGD